MKIDFDIESGITNNLPGIDAGEYIKNQLTCDMTSFIMPIGLVLVLKWYFHDVAENTLFLLISSEAGSGNSCVLPFEASVGRRGQKAHNIFFRVGNNISNRG